MGQQLIKQPNGFFCYWSTVTDSINGFDYTPEDYIEQQAKEMAFDAALRIYKTALALENGGKPHHQFTKTWDEAAHPTCDCGEEGCPRCSGREERSEEVLKWIANVEAGKQCQGDKLEPVKELEIRKAPFGVTAMGVYVKGTLVGYVAKHSFAEGWHWETSTKRYKGPLDKGIPLLDALSAVSPDVDPEILETAISKD